MRARCVVSRNPVGSAPHAVIMASTLGCDIPAKASRLPSTFLEPFESVRVSIISHHQQLLPRNTDEGAFPTMKVYDYSTGLALHELIDRQR